MKNRDPIDFKKNYVSTCKIVYVIQTYQMICSNGNMDWVDSMWHKDYNNLVEAKKALKIVSILLVEYGVSSVKQLQAKVLWSKLKL